MQMYRHKVDKEQCFILVGILRFRLYYNYGTSCIYFICRTTCNKPEMHLLAYLDGKIRVILPMKYKNNKKVKSFSEIYGK